jgi:hypothetical protein
VLARVNAGIARIVSRGGAEKFPRQLPDGGVWLAAVLLAFGLAATILGTAGTFRRVILWLSAVILVAAWAPVLSSRRTCPGDRRAMDRHPLVRRLRHGLHRPPPHAV